MDKYSVFLVDDENIILEGLKIIVNWEKLGFCISGTFYDGDEAEDAALKLRPDLIITDIRMPGLNGLKLIEQLKGKLPDTKFVILSGYDDFKYAQQSIQLGAFDYLLKPVGEEQIKELLRKVYRKITEERDKKKQNEIIESELKKDRQDILKSNIHTLVKGIITKSHADITENVFKNCRHLNEECTLAIIKMDKYLKGMNRYDYNSGSLEKVMKVILKVPEAEYVFYEGEGIFFLIFDKLANIEDCIAGLKADIGKLNETISVAYMTFINFFNQANGNYTNILEVMDNRIYEGKNKIYKMKAYSRHPVNTDLRNLNAGIDRALISRDSSGAVNLITEFYNEMKKGKNCSIEYIRRTSLEIYMHIKELLHNELQISINDVFREDILLHNTIERLEVLDDYIQWFQMFFDYIFSYIFESGLMESNDTINQVKYYLNRHYNEQISLQSISDKFGINLYYLSQLFKKETGENFVNYLSRIRIEKAKKLLKDSGFSVKEIAGKVGYDDEKYFIKVFSKQAGLSPGRYRET
jgi:Response regulator containing CheY-like receiver domain and AraC-type DNA-binding domain